MEEITEKSREIPKENVSFNFGFQYRATYLTPLQERLASNIKQAGVLGSRQIIIALHAYCNKNLT